MLETDRHKDKEHTRHIITKIKADIASQSKHRFGKKIEKEKMVTSHYGIFINCLFSSLQNTKAQPSHALLIQY